LINVADGSQLWGAEYDSSLADILSVQDEVSRKISQSLRLRLTGEDEEKLAKRYTKDAEAYQLYLRDVTSGISATKRDFATESDTLNRLKRRIPVMPWRTRAWRIRTHCSVISG